MKKKEEELKRLKNEKKKEMKEKIREIQQITGNAISLTLSSLTTDFSEEDLEGDFDPERFDQRMQELFSEDFYTGDDQQAPGLSEDANEEENSNLSQARQQAAKHKDQLDKYLDEYYKLNYTDLVF